MCTCPIGVTGANCETGSVRERITRSINFIDSIVINECDSNPCSNGATCNDLPNGFTCTCRPGYTGKFCQTGTLHHNF